MSSMRYTDEFKVEAVRQVTERGFKVADVAERPGITLKKAAAYFAGGKGKIRVHAGASPGVQAVRDVSGAEGEPGWRLRLAAVADE